MYRHVQLPKFLLQFFLGHFSRFGPDLIRNIVFQLLGDLYPTPSAIHSIRYAHFKAYLVNVVPTEQPHVSTSSTQSGCVSSPRSPSPSVPTDVRFILRIDFAELGLVETSRSSRLECDILAFTALVPYGVEADILNIQSGGHM
jgi:hypothetical protein